MQKRESKFVPVFQSWLKNVYKKTCAWETKVSTEDSWPYSRLEEHQETALLAVANGTFSYKISDESIGFKPFDGFCYDHSPAYVAILYEKSNTFYVIPINNLVFYRYHRAKRKSLTELETKEISIKQVKLK